MSSFQNWQCITHGSQSMICGVCQTTETASFKAERDRLLALNAQVAGENIKLRKALEEISTHGGALKHSDGTETIYTIDPTLIARAALGEKDG